MGAAIPQTTRDLQQECGLAHAGLSPDEDGRPTDQAAAEHAVDLTPAGGETLGL
jgi:hypothetical protein